jgi:uncharacterized protein with HEPN domain
MQRNDLIYAGHMLDMIRAAIIKVRGKTRSEFDDDDNLKLALTHLIQNIGEAASRVSPGFRQAHPEIPWAKLISMRHKVVHDHLHVDYDIVWGVVTVNLPPLATEFERIVPPDP